jgi:hypothetical protein
MKGLRIDNPSSCADNRYRLEDFAKIPKAAFNSAIDRAGGPAPWSGRKRILQNPDFNKEGDFYAAGYSICGA